MKVCENIHQIKIEFEITEKIKRYVFIYLITGRDCYLIDSGVAGSKKIIEEYMIRLGRKITEIKGIFLTHAHPDHIGGAAEIKRASGCKVYISDLEREWAENIDKQFKDRPIPNFYTLVKESVVIDEIIKNKDVFHLEQGLTITVLETPGHSHGDISFVLEEKGIIFTGDAILNLDDFPIFVDEEASEKSLEAIRKLKGIQLCCPAWDKIYTGQEIEKVTYDSILFLRRLKSCVRRIEVEYIDRTEDEQLQIICREMGLNSHDKNLLFKRSIIACKEK